MNVFYPLSLIEKLVSSKYERTISDPFESGVTNTRRTWSAQTFKRQLKLTHAPLTLTEFRYLRSFYSQRNGQYDSFWFRDNVHRDGNISVRFATALQSTLSGGARLNTLDFAEVAPIRALPEFDEVTTAAGTAPLLWYDANREFYCIHAGSNPLTESATWDSMLQNRATWMGGSLNLGNILSQYQHYAFTGIEWAQSLGTVPLSGGTQPALTIFFIARHSATTTRQVLVAMGSAANLNGIVINTAGSYAPVINADPGWSTAVVANSPADTWRSIAAVWAASSNTATMYANAVATSGETHTRSYGSGPVTIAAAANGSTIMNPSNAMTNANLAHILVFNSALSAAQIKSLHNLLGYQYGLALVP